MSPGKNNQSQRIDYHIIRPKKLRHPTDDSDIITVAFNIAISYFREAMGRVSLH